MKTKGLNTHTAPKGMLILPVLFLLVSLVLLFVGVLPAIRDIDEAHTSIAKLKADLHQQKTLLPVYRSLEERKEKALPEGISVKQLQPLKIEDLADLPEVFETLATESEVELVSVTPQVRSLQNGRELLRVDVRMRGEFLTFNKLLNRFNEMPFVESIESIAIDVTDLGHEVRVSVWLAIQ